MDNTSMRLLQRFSYSFLSVEYPSAANPPTDAHAYRRKVEYSFNVLKNLEENANDALAGGSVSPIIRKRGKPVTIDRHFNPLPFNSLGITVPITDTEVRHVYVGVLSQLQSILKVCGFVTDSLSWNQKSPALSPCSQEATATASFQIRVHEGKPIVGRRARSISGPRVSHDSVDEGRAIL